MLWDYSKILTALIAVPFLILFFIFEWRKRKIGHSKYADIAVFSRISLQNSRSEIARRISLVFAYVFFILALAGPRWGMVSRQIKEKGASVVIALDVSASMFCEDVKPNRFKASVSKIKEIISSLPSARFGIVGFAGRAFSICPVTGDIPSVKMFLDEIDASIVPCAGTNIQDALKKAKECFGRDTNSKTVVLFTDGENLQGNPEEILKELKGIRVIAVGVGTPDGEPIPVRDDKGNITGYKKKENGETVISHLDETTLLTVANKTSGKYFPYSSSAADIEKVADEINSAGKDSLGKTFSSALARKYQIPLAAALFFILVDFFLPYVFKNRNVLDSFRRRVPAVLLAVVLSRGTLCASPISRGNRAFKNRDFFNAEKLYKEELKKKSRPEIYYNLGNVYYLQEKNDEAQKQYRKAMTFEDIDFKNDVIYNMGNSFFREGKTGEAIESYRRVLRENPRDSDALHNLEIALKKAKGEDRKSKGEGEKKPDKSKESMSKEDVQRVLNVIENMEKNGKMQKKVNMPKVSQDW
ncbi:MAG: VWA domain-containing protein [bacterium]